MKMYEYVLRFEFDTLPPKTCFEILLCLCGRMKWKTEAKVSSRDRERRRERETHMLILLNNEKKKIGFL